MAQTVLVTGVAGLIGSHVAEQCLKLGFSVVALAAAVARSFGVPPDVEHPPARLGVVHAFASHDKARRVISPPAPIDLEGGIERKASWVRARGPVRPSAFSVIEVPINLPTSWRPPPG